MNYRFQKFIRITAFLTLCAYIPTNLSYAQPVSAEVSVPSSFKQNFALALPSDLGRLEMLSPGHRGTVLHIQTAHGHYEAQIKIQKLLEWLSEKYGNYPVLVEGATGKLDSKLLNFFPNQPEKNQKTARWLAKKALVKGPELYLLNHPQAEGYGLENEAAYRDNHKQFTNVLHDRESAQEFSAAFDKEMDKAATLFSPEMRAFLKRLEQHELGLVGFEAWLPELKALTSKHLKMDLSDTAWQVRWPMLVRYFKLCQLSKKWDAAAYQTEKQEFLSFLKKHASMKGLYAQIELLLNSAGQSIQLPEPETENIFVEMLRRLPFEFNFKDYPQVSQFIGMLILQSELNPAQLGGETARLEEIIAAKLARSEDEKKWLQIFSQYRLLKKLLALQLTPDDYEKILSNPQSFRPSEISAQMKGSSINSNKLDHLFNEAFHFYKGAKKRDELMIQNVEEHLKNHSSRFAVVVTGGFHSDAMRKHFEEEGYTYGIVTPSLSGLDEEGYQSYLKAMLRSEMSSGSAPNNLIELEYATSRLGRELRENQILPSVVGLVRASLQLPELIAHSEARVNVAQPVRSELRAMRSFEQGGLDWDVFENYEAISQAAAKEVLDATQEAIRERGHAVLLLPTGNTPKRMHQILAQWGNDGIIDFTKVTIFMLDEYRKGKDYHDYVHQNLVDLLPANNKPRALHILNGLAKRPSVEAKRYERLIKQAGGIDLAVLGIGPEGHIGFNEKGSPLDSRTRLVKLAPSTIEANPEAKANGYTHALSAGIGTILESRRVILIANGDGKIQAIKDLHDQEPSPQLPATALKLHQNARIIVDSIAAGSIGRSEFRNMEVADGKDSFTPKHRDPELHAQQKAFERANQRALPQVHADLLKDVNEGRVHLLGQEDDETAEAIAAATARWQAEGDQHTILIGSGIDSSAEAMIGKWTRQTNWQTEPGKGLSKIHVIESYDPESLENILRRIPASERQHVRLVRVGAINPQMELFVAELIRNISGIHSKDENHPELFNAATLPLLASGLVDQNGKNQLVLKLHKSAAAQHQKWKELSSDQAELKKYPAYKLAALIARLAQSGQNLIAFWMYSTVFRLFSPWLAQLYNQAVANSSTPVVFSGEWATQYWHSTMQAVRQAKGLDEKLERYGFIAIVMLVAHQTRDVIIPPSANHQYRGFGYRLFLKTARAALTTMLHIANRLQGSVDFEANTPEDLGAAIHMMQVSAHATGRLLTPHEENDAVPALEQAIARNVANAPATQPIENGKIRVRQNILSASSGDAAQLTGVLGERIESELAGGEESPTLDRVLSVLNLIVDRVSSKVIKPYRNKSAKDHLNPDTVEKEMRFAKAAANIFTNDNERIAAGKKPAAKVFSVAIGGSTFGPILADSLGLNKGPEVVEVASIDPEEMSRLIDDINQAEDPETLMILVTSKSGVTTETDVAFTTLYEALTKRLSKHLRISVKAAEKIARRQILVITDAQSGKLRDMVKARGLRSIDHPALIGGRWSMFSSVGLIHYFLKGGDEASLRQAIENTPDWDKDLEAALKAIKEEDVVPGLKVKDALNPENKTSAENRRLAIRFVMERLSTVSGAWEGVLANLQNQIDGRDTEVVVGMSRPFEQLVSHKNPGMAQVGSESLGKPGSRFFRTALYGWLALKRSWNRLISNARSSITLFHTVSPNSNLANQDQAAYEAVVTELQNRKVPFMSFETGPMNAQNLMELMFFEYRRLAVMAALFHPMDVGDEGQVGVEDYKKKINAFLLRVRKTVETARRKIRNGLRNIGVQIPNVSLDEIDTIGEVAMDLSKWMGEPAIAKFLTRVIQGENQVPGLMSEETVHEIRQLPVSEIPAFLKSYLLDKFNHPKVAKVYIDGEESDVNPGSGEWVIVATSLDSHRNLESNSANGFNFQVYRRVPRDGDDKGLKWLADVHVAFGSDDRIIISDETMTQDYILKGEEGNRRLVEHDRVGESNRAVFASVGKTLAPGGLSSERPEGFQDYEREIQRNLSTQYRFSDTQASDFNLILNKQGLFTAWTTWSEAVGLAKTAESASGMAMFMSEEGMWHIADNANHVLRESVSAQGGVLSRDQVYVYIGSPQSVREIQVFMDYLIAQNETGSPVVLDILKALDGIAADADPKLRAQALVWLLRLQEGIDVIPSKALSKDSKILKTLNEIKKQVPALLAKLNHEEVSQNLLGEYLGLDVNTRRSRAEDFILLGQKSALLRFNPSINEDEEMKQVYELESLFERTPALKLLELIEQRSSGEAAWRGDLAKAITASKANYRKNAERRRKPEPPAVPQYDFRRGQEFSNYSATRSGIPDAVKKEFGLDSNREPQDVLAAKKQLINIILNEQEVKDIESDRDMMDLRARRPDVFFVRDGKLFVKSLHDIRRSVEDDKYSPIVNSSGDVSSLLDSIFNPILIHFMSPYVSDIISEENNKVIKGGLVTGPGRPRLAFFLDPIDGSSQTEVGGVFGMIAAFAFLHPNQDLSDPNFRKTFKPRKQMLGSFEIVFGFPRTILRLVNRAVISAEGQAGKGEVVQFELFEPWNKPHGKEFRLGRTLQPLDRLIKGRKFQGWFPVVDPKDPRGLGFAMGGSLPEFLPETGHAELMRIFQDDLGGFHLSYTGGFVDDMGKLLAMGADLVLGIVHSYWATNGHRHGRYRYWFELLHYALMLDVLGGEVSDGEYNLLDREPVEPEVADEPSGAETPSISASPPLSKFAYAFYAKFRERAGEELNAKQRWELAQSFKAEYLLKTEKIMQALVAYSAKQSEPKTAEEILSAFFSLPGNIYTNTYPVSESATVDFLSLAADAPAETQLSAAYRALFARSEIRLEDVLLSSKTNNLKTVVRVFLVKDDDGSKAEIDLSQPNWRTKIAAAGYHFQYERGVTKGKPEEKVARNIENLLNRANAATGVSDADKKIALKSAIRLFTLNYELLAPHKAAPAIQVLPQHIQKTFVQIFGEREKLLLAGKMGGTTISWTISSRWGIIDWRRENPTHVDSTGRKVSGKTLTEIKGLGGKNELTDILDRLMEPMAEYWNSSIETNDSVRHPLNKLISGYVLSTPGWFDGEGKLIAAQENILNMNRGYHFDGPGYPLSIPSMLLSNHSIRLLGRTVHDGTAHGMGEMNQLYGKGVKTFVFFGPGSGTAHRLMVDGEPFLGGVEISNIHNELPNYLMLVDRNDNGDTIWRADWDLGNQIARGNRPSLRVESKSFEKQTAGVAFEHRLRKALNAKGFRVPRKMTAIEFALRDHRDIYDQVNAQILREMGNGFISIVMASKEKFGDAYPDIHAEGFHIVVGGKITTPQQLRRIKAGAWEAARAHPQWNLTKADIDRMFVLSSIHDDVREFLTASSIFDQIVALNQSARSEARDDGDEDGLSADDLDGMNIPGFGDQPNFGRTADGHRDFVEGQGGLTDHFESLMKRNRPASTGSRKRRSGDARSELRTRFVLQTSQSGDMMDVGAWMKWARTAHEFALQNKDRDIPEAELLEVFRTNQGNPFFVTGFNITKRGPADAPLYRVKSQVGQLLAPDDLLKNPDLLRQGEEELRDWRRNSRSALGGKFLKAIAWFGMGGSATFVKLIFWVRSKVLQKFDVRKKVEFQIAALDSTDPAARNQVLLNLADIKPRGEKEKARAFEKRVADGLAEKGILWVAMALGMTSEEPVINFATTYALLQKYGHIPEGGTNMRALTLIGSSVDAYMKSVGLANNLSVFQWDGRETIPGRGSSPAIGKILWPLLLAGMPLGKWVNATRLDEKEIRIFMELAAALDQSIRAGKNKVTVIVPPGFEPVWETMKQLFEESEGVKGKEVYDELAEKAGLTTSGERVQLNKLELQLVVHEPANAANLPEPGEKDDRTFLVLNVEGEEFTSAQNTLLATIRDQNREIIQLDINGMEALPGFLQGLHQTVAYLYGNLWKRNYITQPGVENYKAITKKMIIEAMVNAGLITQDEAEKNVTAYFKALVAWISRKGKQIKAGAIETSETYRRVKGEPVKAFGNIQLYTNIAKPSLADRLENTLPNLIAQALNEVGANPNASVEMSFGGDLSQTENGRSMKALMQEAADQFVRGPLKRPVHFSEIPSSNHFDHDARTNEPGVTILFAPAKYDASIAGVYFSDYIRTQVMATKQALQDAGRKVIVIEIPRNTEFNRVQLRKQLGLSQKARSESRPEPAEKTDQTKTWKNFAGYKIEAKPGASAHTWHVTLTIPAGKTTQQYVGEVHDVLYAEVIAALNKIDVKPGLLGKWNFSRTMSAFIKANKLKVQAARSEARVMTAQDVEGDESAAFAYEVLQDKYGFLNPPSSLVTAAQNLGNGNYAFSLIGFDTFPKGATKAVPHSPAIFVVNVNSMTVHHFDGYRKPITAIAAGQLTNSPAVVFAIQNQDGNVEVFSANGDPRFVLQNLWQGRVQLQAGEELGFTNSPEGKPVNGMGYLVARRGEKESRILGQPFPLARSESREISTADFSKTGLNLFQNQSARRSELRFEYREENVVPAVTFFTRDAAGQIILNEAVLPAYFQHLRSLGVETVMISGATGEFHKMSRALRQSVIEKMTRAAKAEGLRVIAHITGVRESDETTSKNAIRETLENAKRAKAAGADAFALLPLGLFETDQDPAASDLLVALQEEDLSIALYNNPALHLRKGTSLSAEKVGEWYGSQWIDAIKDSSGNLDNFSSYTAIHDTTRGDLPVYQGDEGNIVTAFSRRGRGTVGSSGNVSPILQNIARPENQAQRDGLQSDILVFRSALTADLTQISAGIKYTLSKQGLPVSMLMADGNETPLNAAQMSAIDGILPLLSPASARSEQRRIEVSGELQTVVVARTEFSIIELKLIHGPREGIVPLTWLRKLGNNFVKAAAAITKIIGRLVFAEEFPVQVASFLETKQANADWTFAQKNPSANGVAQVVLHADLLEILNSGDARPLFELLNQFSQDARTDVAPVVVFSSANDLKADLRKWMTGKNSGLSPLEKREVETLLQLLQVEKVGAGVSAEAAMNAYIRHYGKTWGIAVLLPRAELLKQIQGALTLALGQKIAAKDAIVLARIARVFQQASLLSGTAQAQFLQNELPGIAKQQGGWIHNSIQALLSQWLANHELIAVSA